MSQAFYRRAARASLCMVAFAMPPAGWTQGTSTAPPPTPAERAQRDADKVFRMILQHADTPRRAARDEKVAPAAAAPGALASSGRPAPTPARAASPPSPAAATAAAAAPVTAAVPEPDRKVAPTVTQPTAPEVDAVAASPVAPPVAALAPVATLAPVPVTPPVTPRLELVSSVEPEFPMRLLRSITSGKVLVHFEVRPDGTVARTEVVSSPHRGLNAAAEAAVMAWRFKPTGQTLPGQVELRFE